MLKAIPTAIALVLAPMTQANEVIAEQNFNALSSSGTYTTEVVTDGTALSNTSAFNIGGAGLDFQTYWYDSRGVGDGPIDTSEGSDSSDFIGVNSYSATNAPDVGADGAPVNTGTEHNFEFNDVDGRLEVVFEAVDVSGFEDRQLSLNYWVNQDTFESDDFFTVSVSDGSTNVELYSVSEITLQNLASGDAGSASEWQSLVIDLEEVITTNGLGETLTLAVSVDNDSSGENIFIDNVLFSALGNEDNDEEDEGEGTPVEIGACFTTDTMGFEYISAVQGSGVASPLEDSEVVVEGVVTALRNNGFFLQEETADEDTDSQTSEGIFVYYSDTLPTLNSTIRVLGTADEYYDLTQITNVTDILDCGDGSAVTTVSISMPLSDTDDLEFYESMMVSVSELVVFDTNTLWQYGELGLSNELKRQPTDLYAPLTAEYEQQILDNASNIIYVEDDNSSSYPNELSFFTIFSYDNPIRIGDNVSATGPLNYSFSKYRINATEDNFNVFSGREAAPNIDDGNLKIAAFNVLNYFNGEDDGNGNITFDYDTNRGAENEEEFELQQARLVEAIALMDADVVGLMEIENDGYDELSAIQSLVDAVNEQQSDNTQYSFITTSDGSLSGTDAITVGIIYRPSVVTPINDAVTINMPVQYSFQNVRVSILQSFSHDESGEEFAVVVNHFKSKGSTCYEDSTDTTDIDSIQGSCNALRVTAAVTLGDALETAELPERVIILGDLNSQSAEDPLAVLTDYDATERGYIITTAALAYVDGVEVTESVEVTETYGFENVVKMFDPDGFSYWYYGSLQVGSLDHILASSAFVADIIDATHWNINSAEVYQLQYDQALNFYSPEEGYAFNDIGPYRSSDHDPLIVSIEFATDTAEPEVDDDTSSDNDGSGGSLGLGLLLIVLGTLFVRRKLHVKR